MLDHLATAKKEGGMFGGLRSYKPSCDESGEDASHGSALLLTSKGVSNMHRGMFTEAIEDCYLAIHSGEAEIV